MVKVANIRMGLHTLSRDKVERHRRSIQTEDTYPIELAPLGDGTYVIAGNGRHRLAAYIAEGFTSIPANVA